MCQIFCYSVVHGVSFYYHQRNVRSRVSVSNFLVGLGFHDKVSFSVSLRNLSLVSVSEVTVSTTSLLLTLPDLSCVVFRKRLGENIETISIVKPQLIIFPYFGWLITFRCMCDVIIVPRIASTAANNQC